MKVLSKKKIYNGMVELRDHEVERYISKNKPVKVTVGNEYMVLTVAQLKRGILTRIIESQYNAGQMYGLIGYEWKGKPFKEIEVALSIDVRLKLAEAFKKKFPEYAKAH